MIIKLLPDEKKLLLRDIKALQSGVEKKSMDIVLGYFDKNYSDQHGLKYEDIVHLIEEFLKSADSINIMMSGLKVKIDSVFDHRIFFASCSLGLRILARYEGERVLVFGGVIQPSSVKGYFKKQKNIYQLYWAEY